MGCTRNRKVHSQHMVARGAAAIYQGFVLLRRVLCSEINPPLASNLPSAEQFSLHALRHLRLYPATMQNPCEAVRQTASAVVEQAELVTISAAGGQAGI